MRTPARPLVRPTDETHRVTSLELLFDLVFVFAFTQVTAFLSTDVSARGALRGLVLLALLWWAWCSYAWLGNQAKADEGVVRAAMVLAMGAMTVVALAIPEAWDDAPDGLAAPVVLTVALSLVRLLHLGVYLLAAGSDAGLRRALGRTAVPVTVAAALLVTGAAVGGPRQTVLWLLALAVDYTGIYAVGARGWQLPSPGHFAERHGLVVIVALGESIVSLGIGAAGRPLSVPVVTAAVLGLAVSVTLWWLYFDVVALVAERRLGSLTGVARTALGRDSYTYLHFPMVAGIIFLALGLKKVLSYVGDTTEHDLSDPLTGLPLWALFGGVAAYLLAHLAFRLRNVGSLNVQRLAVAVLLVALAPVGARIPALAALGLLAAVMAALVAYESFRFAEARRSIRDAGD